VATFWILLCIAAIAFLNSQHSVFGSAEEESAFGSTDLTSAGPSESEETGESGEGSAAEPGASDASGAGAAESSSLSGETEPAESDGGG
jgi:hypothetical protein